MKKLNLLLIVAICLFSCKSLEIKEDRNKVVSDFLDDYSTSLCLVKIYPKEVKDILKDSGLGFYITDMPIESEGVEILHKLIYNYTKNYKVETWDGNPAYIGHCLTLKELKTYNSLKYELINYHLIDEKFLTKWIKEKNEESGRISIEYEREMFK